MQHCIRIALGTLQGCCMQMSFAGLTCVPLNAMCSKKCAAPLFCAVSYLLPASIQTPTVAVSAKGVVSEATRIPLGRVVTCDMHDL